MLTHDIDGRPNLDRADRGGGAGERPGEGDDRAPSERRVELWRKPVRTGGQDEFAHVEERLRELGERGLVDAVAVRTWRRYVDAAEGGETDGPEAAFERVRRYWDRRERRGPNAEVRDRVQTAGRGRLGPPTDAARIPRAALVEIEDGVVKNVTFADERTGCLTTRLERIAKRERSEGASGLSPE